MKIKQKKGISLIVLVITIIVMIILAAAIILSLSSSGIIGKANEARTKSDVANAKQVVSMAYAEWKLMTLDEQEEKGSFKAYADDKLNEAGFATSGNGGISLSESGIIHTIYVGLDNKQAIIPEGYTVSSVSTEDSVSEGLVIYEGSEKVTDENVEEAQKTRNQFVWIPVDNITDFTNPTSYSAENSEEVKEYESMYNSVKANGGFYIARYEGGIEGTSTLVSKKGMTVSSSFNKKSCENFSNNVVVGHLIYGQEWNAALRFISTEDTAYANSTVGTGNYTDATIKSGSNDDYARNNIYDMAGNYWELTSEYFSVETDAVWTGYYCRGGSSSAFGPVSSASSYAYAVVPVGGSTYTVFTYSVRAALYLK